MDIVTEESSWQSWKAATLYALFFLSGISGLLYETVWLRILTRVVGSTVYATSIVLAAFMAGMAIGGYAIGRFALGAKNSLRLYAGLELAVAVSAVALTTVLLQLGPVYQLFYSLFSESRLALRVFQCVMAFVLMAIPACLMGGTLPVLSGYSTKFRSSFAARIGILYGLNTLGAVVGVLGGGFATIGLWGETVTFGIGATISIAVAALAFLLVLGDSPKNENAASAEVAKAKAVSPYSASVRRWVGFAYAASGFVAMAYEVAWTRIFQIFVGTSSYAFCAMLAAYLIGVGLGSLVFGPLAERSKRPLRLFGVAQFFIAAYGIFGLFVYSAFEPMTFNLDMRLQNVLAVPLLVVFPITTVLGAIFPLVCRCYVADERETSRAVGRLYALNTLGCIFGSIICGFFFIGLLGTRGAILALSAANALIAAAFYIYESVGGGRTRSVAAAVAGGALLIGLAVVSPDPFMDAVTKSVRLYMGEHAAEAKIFFHKESAAATTTAVGIDGQPFTKSLWVNGIGMTHLCAETKLMAHLPLMLHKNPKDALVICFGMGTTVRSMRSHKSIQCDVVELAPDVYDCFKFFHADADQVLADPRIRHFADDGRNFLLVRPKKYDIINVDPAPPIWSAGTVNLYTKEFFELCKDRLNDHGIFCLWIPSAQGDEMRMIMKTFVSVFPNASVWRGLALPAPGFFMMGYKNEDAPSGNEFVNVDDPTEILNDLNEWEPMFSSVESLRGLFLMKPQSLVGFVRDEPIITDDRPYTEFPLWRSIFNPRYDERLKISN